MSLEEEFPRNSRRPIEPNRPQVQGEAKLEKIEGLGKVVRRQKSFGQRMLDTFFRGNGSIVSYLVMDVLVPAAQTLVLDMVTQGLEKKFYGEVRTPPRRPVRGGNVYPSRGPHVSYDMVNRNTVVRGPGIGAGSARRPLPQTSSDDLGDIVLPTEFEVKMIAEKLYETLQEYGIVSVANLKELIGESPLTTDHNWGWVRDDAPRFVVRRIRDGFMLDYPEPVDLR